MSIKKAKMLYNRNSFMLGKDAHADVESVRNAFAHR